MAEKLYAVRLLDPAQAELEEIARLYLALAGVHGFLHELLIALFLCFELFLHL